MDGCCASAFTAFDQRQLDARGIESIDDLQFQPPSVVADARSELTVRGVGAAVLPGGQPAVAVAQDGVTAARAAPLAALHDLERIEIERGPVGPIDGRGVGGAARLTTRRPGDAFAAGLDYEIGSRAESRLRATLNAPLADDRASARLAVLYGEGRGIYGLPASDERDSADEDLLSVRTSLRYRLAEDLLADASWTFTRQDAEPLSFDTGTDGVEDTVRTPSQQGQFGTLGLTWRLGDFVLASTSGYQSAEWSQRLSFVVASDDVRVWSSRLELRFDDGGPFRVRMGLGYWDEKNEGAGERVVSASLDPPAAFAQAYARTVDGFTDVTYEVLPGWRTHAGFRIAYDERKLVDRSADPSPARRRERNPVTWRVGTDVDVAERTLLYGTIGTADRPGGFDFASAASFADEDLLAYQIGAEQRLLSDRAHVDLAAFYYDYDDVQTTVAVPGAGAVRVASLPAAESYGVELESSVASVGLDGLLLDGAIGWLHTRIGRGTAAGVDLEGGELPLAPQISAHLGAQYTVVLAQRIAAALPGAVTARADYAFRDRMFFDAGNRNQAAAWSFADLRLIYGRSPDKEGLRVEAFVENLWNERAVTAALPLRTAPDALLSYNEARTFGVRISTTLR